MTGIRIASYLHRAMKVAITIWNDRVSPVLDTARRLKIVALDNGQKTSEDHIDIPDFDSFQRVQFMRDLGVDILICGAVSHQLEMLLRRAKINVFSWIRGNIDDIISACSRNNLDGKIFRMPGYFHRQRGQGRGRGRGRRCCEYPFIRRQNIKEEES
jgi:predicted Fe-Mo cluster-binding NifX family protein